MQLVTPSEVAIAVRITNPSVFIGRTFLTANFKSVRTPGGVGWKSRLGSSFQGWEIIFKDIMS